MDKVSGLNSWTNIFTFTPDGFFPRQCVNNPKLWHQSETICHLCDDQGLPVLRAPPQGEAPGCFALEQHLHQLLFFILCSVGARCASPHLLLPPPLHPSCWNSQVISGAHRVHNVCSSVSSINVTSLWEQLKSGNTNKMRVFQLFHKLIAAKCCLTWFNI